MGDTRDTYITPKTHSNVVIMTKGSSLRLLEQLVGSLAVQCLISALGKNTMNTTNLVNFRSLETYKI